MQVGCSIRSRYMSNVNQTSPWLKSNTYWAGIRVTTLYRATPIGPALG